MRERETWAGGGGVVSMQTARVKTCQRPMPGGGPRAPGRWWKAAEPGMRSGLRGTPLRPGGIRLLWLRKDSRPIK